MHVRATHIGSTSFFVIDENWTIDIAMMNANRDSRLSSKAFRMAYLIALIVELWTERSRWLVWFQGDLFVLFDQTDETVHTCWVFFERGRETNTEHNKWISSTTLIEAYICWEMIHMNPLTNQSGMKWYLGSDVFVAVIFWSEGEKWKSTTSLRRVEVWRDQFYSVLKRSSLTCARASIRSWHVSGRNGRTVKRSWRKTADSMYAENESCRRRFICTQLKNGTVAFSSSAVVNGDNRFTIPLLSRRPIIIVRMPEILIECFPSTMKQVRMIATNQQGSTEST